MQELDWKWVLTSFEGRLNRKPYWMAVLTVLVLTVAVFVVSLGILPQIIGMPLIVVAVIAGMFINLAISVKRLHDRDKSAHWLWVFIGVPFLLGLIGGFLEASGTGAGFALVLNLIGTGISLWMLVELGFLRGTDGPNRFGHDPLGGTASRPSPIDRLGRL